MAPPKLLGRNQAQRMAVLRNMARRNLGRGHDHVPQQPLPQPLLEQPREQSPEMMNIDFPDFQTDFDADDLAEQLAQMREDADPSNDTVNIAQEVDENTALTAQDEELPTMQEMEELANLQLVDEDNPFEDEASDLEDLLDLTDPEATAATLEDAAMADAASALTQDASSRDPEITLGKMPADGNPMAWARNTKGHDDISEPYTVPRKYQLLPDIHMALGIWAQVNGVSGKEYQSLRQILTTQVTSSSLEHLQTLPATVTTLKKQVQERLPLLELRKASVKLDAAKLTTGRRTRAEEGGTAPSQELFFFNPLSYAKVFLSSAMCQQMHFGYAQLIETPNEPWHSSAWASSIRATGSHHPRYAHDDNEPIFPSDFVEYKCHNDQCTTCTDGSSLHRGRVLEIWQEERDKEKKPGDETILPKGTIIAKIEPLVSLNGVRMALAAFADRLEGFPEADEEIPPNEVVLVKDRHDTVKVSHILRRITSVHIDKTFGSSVQLKDDIPIPQVEFLIRRKYNQAKGRIYPIVKSAPVRGDIEIEEFTRQALVDTLVHRSDDADILTIPLILFADGFGLYRTLHKSIMGIYLSIAALPREQRLRQMNIMPLTLGPHGSNDGEVWDCMSYHLRQLEEGFTTVINGKKVFVQGHIHGLAGDFPQQQDNSGFKRPTATQGCRLCTVTLTDRGNLEFDLSSGRNGRYHPEIMRQRQLLREMKEDGRPKTHIEAKAREFGMTTDDPALLAIFPAIDIIRTRPADSAHSEFGGLTKMLHLMIVGEVLTPKGMTEYSKALRKFPMFPTWARIQSPHHVLQYSLTEHGQWSAIAPLMTRVWLKKHPEYMKAPFKAALRETFASDISKGDFGTEPDEADILTRILVENFHTNVILTLGRLPESFYNRTAVEAQIKLSRGLFQKFVLAITKQASRGRSRSVSIEPSKLPTVASGPEVIEAGQSGVQAAVLMRTVEDIEDPRKAMESAEVSTIKSAKYKLWISRPNVHIGLHYGDAMDEFGLVSIMMVMVFEAKHKLWKRIVYSTNHRSPEKDLFMWESFVQTIRFLLLDGYADDPYDAAVAVQMKMLHEAIPAMFASILSGTEVPGAGDAGNGDEEEVNALVSLNAVVNDEQHKNTTVLGRLKDEKCREFQLPTRGKQMTREFNTSLSKAYERDWKYPVTLGLAGVGFKWWKSVSWDAVDGKHVVKRRGQYVQYMERDNGDFLRLARLDQIMTHEAVAGQRIRVLIMVSPVLGSTETIDHTTNLPFYQHGQPIVIGLPVLLPTVLYMVPFTRDDKDNWEFVPNSELCRDGSGFNALHVNWDLGFM